MKYTASSRVAGDPASVRRVLLDVSSAPAWNPAFSSVRAEGEAARAGSAYRVTIRGVVPARLVVDVVEAHLFEYRLEALGSRERGAWSWTSVEPGVTCVSHAFEHQGLVAQLLQPAFASVAGWRVGRLRAEVVRRASG